MLKILSNQQHSLAFKSKFLIVYGYQPKRSPFDKTSYIDGWIPRQTQFAKQRKPRLSQWEDENTVWPKLFPSPTQLSGKALIKQIEQEEQSKIVTLRNFHIPDFRVGDVIQFKWIHNISEAKENTYTALVLGRNKINSLEGSFKVMFRHCGVQCYMYVKQFSPYLRDLKVVTRGSGNIRKKLSLWDQERTSSEITAAMINRSMKRRQEDGARGQSKVSSKKIDLDNTQDPLLSK